MPPKLQVTEIIVMVRHDATLTDVSIRDQIADALKPTGLDYVLAVAPQAPLSVKKGKSK